MFVDENVVTVKPLIFTFINLPATLSVAAS